MIYECEAALHALVALRDKPSILVTRPAGLALDGVWRAYGEITRRNIGPWIRCGEDAPVVQVLPISVRYTPPHVAVQTIYTRVHTDPSIQHVTVEEYYHENHVQP